MLEPKNKVELGHLGMDECKNKCDTHIELCAAYQMDYSASATNKCTLITDQDHDDVLVGDSSANLYCYVYQQIEEKQTQLYMTAFTAKTAHIYKAIDRLPASQKTLANDCIKLIPKVSLNF